MGVEFSESRPSMMILRQRVRIFCVVAELKSFTLAARELGISQSMVSRKVSELEAELGVRLFDHEVRPIALTSSGEALHQLISQEINRIDDQLGLIKGANKVLAPLKIGFVESIARSMSWSILKDIHHDVSSVTVLTGICSYLLNLLDQGKLDVIFSPNPFTYRNDLDRRFVFREPSVILLPKNSGVPAKPTWQQLQFCGLPMLQYSKDNSGGGLDQKYFNKLGLRFAHRIEVDINALALDYIAHGEGWTLTRPTSLVQHPDLAELIDIRPMPEPIASREIYVITRKGFNSGLAAKITSSAVASFVNNVASKMLDYAPWIRPYILVRGPREEDRVALYGHSDVPAGSHVYIL